MGIFLLIITIGSGISVVGRTEYQFIQLDTFFEKNLFGVEFDYNPSVSKDQALLLKTDLINQTTFTNVTDPDLEEDNIIALVGHESQDIKTAFLALEQVKRTQEIPLIGSIEWCSTVPFAKFLHQFSLPTGEDVILGQDLLGISLKVNGSGFDPSYYQLGYANVPSDFLEFLIPDSQNSSFNSSVGTSIVIQESMNELQIDLTYDNLTYLFQRTGIDLDKFIDLSILYDPEKRITAEHLMIIQFDTITFSLIIRKYTHHGTSGVETLSEISIGNVINLIINEGLPQDETWTNAIEYEIQEKFMDLIQIPETFSWYQGSNITTRLKQFSNISFSLISSQNIGVLNGTQPVNNVQLVIDSQNRTTIELDQSNFPVIEEISAIHDEQLLFSTKVKGRNFAIQQADISGKISLIPIETQVIALNQQKGFANNTLFLQETSLLEELVAECMKRFIADSEVSMLGTSEIITKGNLDLTSAQYFQDFQVVEWSGLPFTINLIQFAVKTAPLSTTKTRQSQITLVPTVPGILGLLILSVVVRREKREKRKFNKF